MSEIFGLKEVVKNFKTYPKLKHFTGVRNDDGTGSITFYSVMVEKYEDGTEVEGALFPSLVNYNPESELHNTTYGGLEAMWQSKVV